MRRTKRTGFTLVELLVVIAIIGILVGLLLPAVQAAREAARRTQCVNNIRNLALSVVNFEGAKKSYPGYQNLFAFQKAGASGEPSGKVGTWVVALLPYLEQQPLADNWDDPALNAPWAVVVGGGTPAALENFFPKLAITACPSDTTQDAFAQNSYIANCGFWVHSAPSAVLSSAPYNTPARGYVSQTPQNGVFVDKIAPTTARVAKVSSDSIRDGTSQTLMFSESLQADGWHYVGRPFIATSVEPELAAATAFNSTRVHIGMLWHYRLEDPANPPNGPYPGRPAADVMKNPNKINGNKLDSFSIVNTAANYADYARPSSNHPGVVVACMLDGSTKTIDEQINYHVYQALMTPQTKQSDVPAPNYLLKDSDFVP